MEQRKVERIAGEAEVAAATESERCHDAREVNSRAVAWADQDLSVLHVREHGIIDREDPVSRTRKKNRRIHAVNGLRHHLIVILNIHDGRGCKLLGVAQAARLASGLSGLCKNRKQDGCKNRDDGDNDQEFNKGKG